MFLDDFFEAYGGVILLVGIFVHVFISEEFYRVSKLKGYKDIRYLIIPLLTGVVGYLLVMSLPLQKDAVDIYKDEE